MEVRANYIIVGLFALAVLLGGLGFTVWIAKQNKDADMQLWDIHIRESVVGLSVNNDVVFDGVPVGKVAQIKISRTEPGSVIVRANLLADTPIREDSLAALQMRGVTGVYIINISGGTAQSPIITVPKGEVGVIRFRPSPLAAMVQTVPETLAKVNQLLERVERLFSDANIQALNTTLASVAEITSAAANAGNIGTIMQSAEATAKEINNLVVRAGALIETAEPGVKRFSKEGLSEMRMLMIEARALVQTLSRIGKHIENNPRRFFFGDQVKEYTP